MIDISVAPEVGIVMQGSLKDKELSFQFFVSFFFFFNFNNIKGFLEGREFSLAPFIFMASVHPPPPHPKFSMWQKTGIFCEPNISGYTWLRLEKKSHIYRNESSCKQAQCPLTVITSSERSVWNLATKTVYFVLTFLSRTVPCKKRSDRLWGR